MRSTVVARESVTQMPSSVVAMRKGRPRWGSRPRWPRRRAPRRHSCQLWPRRSAREGPRRRLRRRRLVFALERRPNCLPSVRRQPERRVLCGMVGVGAAPVRLGWRRRRWRLYGGLIGRSSMPVVCAWRGGRGLCLDLSEGLVQCAVRSRPVSKSKRLGAEFQGLATEPACSGSAGRASACGMLAPSTRYRDDTDFSGLRRWPRHAKAASISSRTKSAGSSRRRCPSWPVIVSHSSTARCQQP